MSQDQRIVRLAITGRVQGVGFRAFLADQARRRGLRGFVRNRRDGSVEALIAGPRDRVAEIIETARRGPRSGRVASVEIEDAPAVQPDGDVFTIAPTI